MNELKPCPFCGGNALIQVVRDLGTGGYYSHYIFCDDCGGRVQECITSASGTSYCVEYAADGKIEQRRFYEDELENP